MAHVVHAILRSWLSDKPIGVRRLMRITQLTPGTGHFYCGNCLRDGALASGLIALGHEVTMVPLYLPIMSEEPEVDESPVFLGGINMYLRHKVPMAARMPRPIARLLDTPGLLRWSSKRGDMTDAATHADMTLAVLRGDDPSQRTEVDRLLSSMQGQSQPDVVCLCNALLTGIAGRIRTELGVPVICTLHGEDTYIDALPEPARTQAWETMRARAADISLFIAVSEYYAKLMTQRLKLDPERVVVVHNGIRLDDIADPPSSPPQTPTIGYLARMCPDKGLHTLVDAFIELKRRNTVPQLRLAVAGAMLKADRTFVQSLMAKLEKAGCRADTTFTPNINRGDKLRFLTGLSVFSVPATYGESFGLYVLEALAHAVPVVQPDCSAFPEVLSRTGGGLLCKPNDPISLANQLERFLCDRDFAVSQGRKGREAVFAHYGSDRMAQEVAAACARVVAPNDAEAVPRPTTITSTESFKASVSARSHT